MRLFLLFLLSGGALFAQNNYADEMIDQLGQRALALRSQSDPVAKALLAEEVYYLAHESGRQQQIVDIIQDLYDRADHQELKAELGHFLIQQYRQLSQYDRVSTIVKELGYVSEWTVFGPLAPDADLDLKKVLKSKSLQGLDRTIKPYRVAAYGADDYWSEGVGHYGLFSADHAVFPNQLAGALFTTQIEVPEKGVYRLGLGWDHITKAWINRTPVFEARANQDAHPDQGVVYFNLKKGKHRLTVYVETPAENPSLAFFARITDLAGHPIPTRAVSTGKVRSKKPRLVQGETPLLELAEDHSSSALAGLLLLKEQQIHAKHGILLEVLSRAFKENPTRRIGEKLLGQTTDPNERLHYLSEFLDHVPQTAEHALDRAWAVTQLGQIALAQDRYWEARNYADEALKIHPDYWPAVVLKNNTFSALGLNGEALRQTIVLAERYPNVPWIMMDLADAYDAMDFEAETETWVDRVLAVRAGSVKFSNRKVALLKKRGDTEGLLQAYQRILSDAPYSVAVVLDYAQFLSTHDRVDDGKHLIARFLTFLPDNPFLLEGLGEIKLKNGEDDALVYLEKALAIRPQNPALENLIALSKSDEKPFYEAYRIDAPADVNLLEVSDVALNIDNTVTKLAPNGSSSVYRQLQYEILSDRGYQKLPGYSFSYSPLRQKPELIKAEIHRDGQIIPLTKFGRSRISDPAYRMYYDLVSYQIPFPTLKIGDIINIEYRIDETKSNNIFGDYFGDLNYFANEFPAKTISYTLIFPKGREIHYHVEKMKPRFDRRTDGEDQVYTWTRDRVSPFETESLMPGLDGYLPYVAVSTFNDWQHMARWYKDLIEDQLVLDHETKKIVADLIKGVTDPLTKVKRIHEYVLKNTRYVALEFGIHGYKPYQVNQVCTRQFGDCKDKAGLIVAMLREAGIPADIAIVRTADRGEIHPFPAMLSYFNHAIAYVPQFDLYLDGTAEFSGINELPEMDQGALTLLVDKNGVGKLTKIPISDDNHQGFQLAVDVQPNGAAQLSGELSWVGVMTPGLRQYLSIDSKLDKNLQNILIDTVPGLDVLESDREGQGINDPITLKFKGVTHQLMQVNDGDMKLPLQILSRRLTQAYTPNAQRKFPIEFGVPRTKSVRLKIGAPEGYRLGDVPETLNVEDENFRVSIQIQKVNPFSCLVDYEIAFKKPRVEPNDYNALRNMMQAHDKVLEQSIQFIAR